MCLLARVLEWNAEGVVCVSEAHRREDHPLRAHGRLGIAAGIELCAQAIAVHGALTRPASSGPPQGGVLASLRSVRFETPRLDDLEQDLLCGARRLAGERATALYEFALRAGDRRLLSGQALVLLAMRTSGAGGA